MGRFKQLILESEPLNYDEEPPLCEEDILADWADSLQESREDLNRAAYGG